METKKHIINLPKNKVAENISVKTENGQIVVNYDLKEKFNLKKGEIYFIETKSLIGITYIHAGFKDEKILSFASYFYNNSSIYYAYYAGGDWMCDKEDVLYFRPATFKEKKTLFDALAKHGKQWNADKMCIEDIFNPKDGDFLVSSKGKIFIYSPYSVDSNTCAGYCGTYPSGRFRYTFSSNWTNKKGCRYATESEKQEFLEKLKEAGYTWNAEKKCLEEYVWKPKKGEEYFFIGANFKVYNTICWNTYADNSKIAINNCFQTEEQAEKKAEELKEVLKKK